MSKPRLPSQRQLRVGELIRHSLAEIFARGEVADPDIEDAGVTVLEVSASPDLKVAKVYVRPFKTGQDGKLLTALARNRRYIRGALSPRLSLKYMPELRFVIDTTLDHAAAIDALLRDPAVARDLDRDDPAGSSGNGPAKA